jgi:hypothetical protein
MLRLSATLNRRWAAGSKVWAAHTSHRHSLLLAHCWLAVSPAPAGLLVNLTCQDVTVVRQKYNLLKEQRYGEPLLTASAVTTRGREAQPALGMHSAGHSQGCMQ